ncbi:unnamed protein product [Urochloa decumbens]|uniref:Ubiquitin-like protease family profile domain-containing protein n=1 Tax=Urochloa decumbens TaxID=240449 RepID=A0ABC9DHK8_9POAL
MARGQKQQAKGPTSSKTVRRNRASPSRIFKLYMHLSDDQNKMICNSKFGGLLNIACATIPSEFANWLFVDCFDAESSQLVFPGRGKILVSAQSVADILGLPDRGDTVRYELDVEAINFIHDKYNVERGSAPKIGSIVKRVKENKEANDDFLRSWLMLAVSTFLCPPTSMGISPRCYPALVHLSKVKDLNWCQFVVDQLKDASTKINKKNSVRGCIQLLAILYADSLEVQKVQPPPTKPRIAAWTRKMLDTVIKEDTNCDGSFGKLKNLGHSVLQDPFIQMDDIQRFVSSKAHRGMTVQKKRKLCQAVSNVMCGVTQLLTTFLHEVGPFSAENEDTDEPSLRRSKRKRTTEPEEAELVSDDEAEDSDYEESDFVGVDSTEESDYEDDGDGHSMDAENTNNMNTTPKTGEYVGNDAHGNTPDRADGHMSSSNPQHEQTDELDGVPLISRLRAIQQAKNQRLMDQSAAHHDAICEPIPLQVKPPTIEDMVPPASKPVIRKERFGGRLKPPVATGTNFDAAKDKLGEGCSHNISTEIPVSKSDSLDFTPPDFDIMKSINEHEPTQPQEQRCTPQPENPQEQRCTPQAEKPQEQQCTPQAEKPQEQQCTPQPQEPGHQGLEPGSAFSLDQIDAGLLQLIEEDAIQRIQERKARSAQLERAPTGDILGDQDAPQASTDTAAASVGTGTTPASMRPEPASVNSSVTPAYQPAPRRRLRKAAVLQSPYVDFTGAKSFRCSKEVCDVYNAVLASQRSSTRSSQEASTSSNKDVIIINYFDFHVTLKELASSVNPRGKLDSVVAEIDIYCIDQRCRKATKRVLPLRVSGYLQTHQLNRSEVKRVFRMGTNHLDHRQMVMFPVLQMIQNKNLGTVGHYFLLVLNIRNNRFEVLDSMRSLKDENLVECCNIIVAAIKELWRTHYPDSNVDVQNYSLVDIGVLIQTNDRDCGYHMLMHAEHWDGFKIYNFQEKDIPNIRKLLTYKWLTDKENETDWKTKLGLA